MKITKIGYVYKITSPNNRIYIGSTCNVKKRWSDYKYHSCKSQTKLYNSFKKHGIENHKFEIIWEGDIENMYSQELLLGLQFNVLSSENLNCKLPKFGEVKSFISEETRLKMQESAKSRYDNMPNYKRELLGKHNLGNKLSEEAIEHRTKLRQKPIVQLDLNDNFIQEWGSAILADKALKISSSDICQCCKNKKKTSGNYKWKYLNELENLICKPRKKRNNEFNINKKAVIQMDLNDNFICVWNSIKDAHRGLNLSANHISDCCTGKRNSSNGFKWKFKL